MTDIGTAVEKEHKGLKLDCDECTYLTFDAIIKDDKRALIDNLPIPETFDRQYTAILNSVRSKINQNEHSIIGIFDSITGQHIIADLYHNITDILEDDKVTGCNSINELKKRMNNMAMSYNEANVSVQQILIADSISPCCEKKAREADNFHEVYELYAK